MADATETTLLSEEVSTPAPAPPQQQLQPQGNPAILYREAMGECQRLMQKIAELEVDRNEHALVEETLKPLDPSRRAYRLVGEVLVERTVAEVLPSVTTNKENVSYC
jgi:chaperonin cofactor prefoldin